MDPRKIERISKALADRTRLRILAAISSRDHMNCAQIVSMRGVTPATVSHHLRILKEAGLIECQRQGQFVHSKMLPQTLGDYMRELSGLARKKTKRAKGRK